MSSDSSPEHANLLAASCLPVGCSSVLASPGALNALNKTQVTNPL